MNIYKLSEYNKEWFHLENDKGIKPSIDFGFTDKFKINIDFYNTIYSFYLKYKNSAKMGKRSLTIQNINEIYNYLKNSGIENIISKISGIKFILHPLKSDSYMYNLTPPLSVQKKYR